MSHYNSIKTQLKDPELILAALKEMGLTGFNHTEAIALRGYKGDRREDMAHIVVPGRGGGHGLSAASNDLGFYRSADGTYALVISDFDKGFLRCRYGQEFQSAFMFEYGLAAVRQSMPGMVISNRQNLPDGTVRCEFEVEVAAEVAQAISLGV